LEIEKTVCKLPNYKITQLQIFMIPRSRKSASHRRSERGYILITLILFVALIAIAALVTAPLIAFQVKRDREEELVHRGVQYSRAMKHFVKKFGRYPTRIEELENTNQVRFLRKRYKDPITGKDFKILHLGDVQLSFGAGIAGATPVNGLNPGAPGFAGGPGGQGGLGPGALNAVALAGALAGAGTAATTTQFVGSAGVGTSVAANEPSQQNPNENADSETAGATPNQGANVAPTGPGAPGAATLASSNPGAQVFGGGPIVGVASTSKDKSIRIFNKKDHYYQWQFIYDPTTDRGGLLTTPNQPSLQGATTAIQGAPGTPGAPGSPGGIPGQPGFGQQPTQPTQPGLQPPQMPPDQGP
jgi:type II secretory pathway pseudopilin PulG